MTGHAFLKLTLLGSLALVPFVAGCAVQTSPSTGEESTSEALSTAAPSAIAKASADEAVSDPLCIQKQLRSDACILDSQWHVEAEALCASYKMKLENFIPSNSCASPVGPTPAPGTGPTTGSNGSDPTATDPTDVSTGVAVGPNDPTTGSGGSTGPISIIRLASTEVTVDCCNGGVGPIVPPPEPVSTGAAK